MTRRTSTGKIFIRTERELLRRLALGWKLTYYWFVGYSLFNPKNHRQDYIINVHALRRLEKSYLVSSRQQPNLHRRYFITEKGRRILASGS